MADPGRGIEQQLEESVRRVLGALERMPVGKIEVVANEVSRAVGQVVSQVDRASRTPTREERRLEKRLREEDEASLPQAWVMAGAAVVAGLIGLTQPQLFWFFFVGFGFAMGAADIFAKVRRRERRQAEAAQERGAAVTGAATERAAPAPLVTPPPPAQAERPALAAVSAREARVDGICDRLLSELSGAPPLVRELLRRPEQTVEALRSASRELARRERELRGMLSEDEGERLVGERAELAARAEAAPDAVVRSRLSAALEALDAQLVHRAELTTAAARIEAEGTRILYSLESLRAQVLRAFAADAAAADVTRESLKGGLETLRGEIDAVATALEEVHGVGKPPVASTAGGPTAAARAALRQAGTR
ncbi:MAG TPA: hypothetical protein P5164_07855 [Thermoanaerobaculia bacterium]|nr:hypothetical protein [Thermoanaerobaculia bacterium]